MSSWFTETVEEKFFLTWLLPSCAKRCWSCVNETKKNKLNQQRAPSETESRSELSRPQPAGLVTITLLTDVKLFKRSQHEKLQINPIKPQNISASVPALVHQWLVASGHCAFLSHWDLRSLTGSDSGSDGEIRDSAWVFVFCVLFFFT